MDPIAFLKKHKSSVIRIFGAAVLCALVAALIVAFRYGLLPYAEDGDAFDTVYAVDVSGGTETD